MPIPELPNELWARIGDFIPADSVKNLYRLNRLFHEIGLDALYREVVLFPRNLSEKRVDGYLHRLLQPDIARRVRAIKIQSATFLPLLPPVPSRGFIHYRKPSKLPSFLKAIGYSRPVTPPDTVFQLANQVILQVTQAEALSLEGLHYLSQEYFELAAKAWMNPTDRLQELKFRGSINEFARLLKYVATPHNLQCLKLQVTGEPVSAYWNFRLPYNQDARSAWIYFLQQVSPTLTELSIEFEPTGELGIAERQLLLSHIFQSVRKPRLRSFKCNVSETVIALCLAPLLEFIGRASGDLEELDVPGLGASEMPDCHFRALKSLTLTNFQWRIPSDTSSSSKEVLETAEAYMTRCSDLSSLILLGEPLSFQQLEGFFRNRLLHHPFQSLHTLQIKVQSLNPQLFVMLAGTLTNLRYMTIHHHGLVPDASLEWLMDRWEGPSFAIEQCIPRFLDQTPLSGWGLTYLGIKALYKLDPTSIPEKELGQALRRLIPSLAYEIDVL